MPSPLSPIEPNVSTPQRSMTSTSFTNNTDDNSYDNSSSPFMSDSSPQSGHSLPRARPISRIISGGELSPLKIVQQQTQNVEQPPTTTTAATEDTPSPAKTMPPPPLPNSPRKMSGAPIKRFPIKVNSTPAANGNATRNANETPRAYERRISLHDAIQENPGLKHAIEIFEDDESMLDIEPSSHSSNNNNSDDTLSMSSEPAASNQGHLHAHHEEGRNSAEDEAAGADDTMTSTYSTFSAVPNMTMFAQMRSDSTSKFSLLGGATPRGAPGQADPSSSRTPYAAGPVPDRSAQYDSGGSNSTNLLDFTEQLRFGGYPQQTPSRDRHLSPSRTAQGNATIGATPQRSSIANLLDFDIPPMPTPRSIPTITPRELESLKSNFLSEISSLKASLSGKEAEVMSLKTAVGDAEKRVGECMEHLRDLRGEHEHLVTDRDSWEKRGREMESVLRKVKEEIVLGQREREELEFKLDEAEKRREAAEMMAQDAESKMAGMRAGKASAEAAAAAGSGSDSGKSPTGVAASNKEVEMAVERVARELHALYKSKHEVKVAALKKSYEGRWEKKVRELQNQVDELASQNEELRRGRDVTTTKVDLARLTELEEERKKEKAQDTTHIKELEAELEKLGAMLKTVQGDNAELRVLLERERVEKGELVMLAEEMMNMQQQQTLIAAEQQQQRQQQEYERQQQQQRQQHEYERQQQQRQHEFERQQHQDRMSNSGNGYSNGNGNMHNNNNNNNRASRSSSSSSGATLHNEGPSAAPAPAPMSLGNKTPGRRNTVAPPSRGTPLTAKRQSQQISSSNGETPATGVSNLNFRNSISAGSRPSSLRAPGGISGLAKPTESRIGRMGVPGHERNKSHGMGLPRPGSGLGMNGGASRGIMSSIEKMGTGGRGYGRD